MKNEISRKFLIPQGPFFFIENILIFYFQLCLSTLSLCYFDHWMLLCIHMFYAAPIGKYTTLSVEYSLHNIPGTINILELYVDHVLPIHAS